jgi:putative membrane protein
MTLRWLIASLHLLALGIGLAAVLDRAWSLRGPLDSAGLRRVFRADAVWGVAAVLWIVTGLLRAFAGLEKGSAYYLGNPLFWVKMSLFVMVALIEILPMKGLASWRTRLRKGEPVNTSRAIIFSNISVFQAVVVGLMVFVAAALARGLH